MKIKRLFCFISLLLCTINQILVQGQTGTVLFKEDFGGNSVYDPPYGSPPLPPGVIEGINYSDHLWNLGLNGYAIRKEAIKRSHYQGNHVWDGWYAEFGDHTYEGDLTRGNFMQIDLDYKEATFYNVRVDDLCENTDLTFSFWGHPVNASVSAPVTLTIEDTEKNVLAQETFYIKSGLYQWQYFSLPFHVPAGTTSIVYRVFSGAGGNGGDFALDDIEIQLNAPPVEVNMPDDSLCIGSNFTIKAKFDNTESSYIEPVTYTWYKNKTKGYTNNDWEKVGSGPTLDFSKLTKADEGYYKVQVSSAGTVSTFSRCESASDIVPILLKMCPVDSTIYDTICYGEKYEFADRFLTTSGTYVDTIKSEARDTIVTLELTALDEIKTLLEDSICNGGTYTIGKKEFTSPGEYKIVLPSASGCDSTIILTLKEIKVKETSLKESICDGETYTLGTQTLTKAGTYKETFTSKAGCDSIVTLTLKVNEVYEKDIEESICEGETYTLGTQTLTKAGTYKENFTSKDGCDSIVTLTLKVIDVYKVAVEESICDGETYTLGTQTLTKAGTYKENFTSKAGCDSIVTLTLKVNEVNKVAIEESICDGETYTLGTQTLTKAGTYKETFTNKAGCDSIVTLTLKVNEVYQKDIEESICDGETYTLGTQTLTKAGTYIENFTSKAGCDSIVTLTLKVNEVYKVAVEESICDGETYTLGTQTLTKAGTYIENFTSKAGCDSIVTLTLKVNEVNKVAIEESICDGETYTLGTQTLTKAGTYKETFTNQAGCDSIVTLTLKVNEVNKVAIEEAICDGETYTLGTQTLTKAGTYKETFTNKAGCDSIVTLTLKVNEVYKVAVEEAICDGETYTLGTQTLTKAGTYIENFTSKAGCDSIVTLTLKVNDVYKVAIEEAICDGETYTLGTQTLTKTGTYIENFTSKDGCDSIVTLTLKVNEVNKVAIEESICEGETYTLGTQTLNTSGTYKETFTNKAGCDSIVTLTLKVNEVNKVAVEETICEGESYKFGNKRLKTAGEYVETFKNIYGCDSIVTLTLKVTEITYASIEETICRGEIYEFGNRSLKNAGQYKAKFISSKGCDSIVTLTLNVIEPVYSNISELICEGESYEFGTQTLTETGKYKETFVSSSGCDSIVTLRLVVAKKHDLVYNDTITQGAIYNKRGFVIDTYEVGDNTFKHEGINRNGCDSIVTLNLFVIEKVVLPDVIPARFMTPNGDGIKDTWEIENLSFYSKYTVTIFDRWGKQLIQYKNYYPGWDGYYLGYPQPSTDYWFVIDLEEIDRQKVGNFTLLR